MTWPIIIELAGAPHGKAFRRGANGHSYLDTRSRDYLARFQLEAQIQMNGAAPTEQPVRVEIEVRYGIPVSWSAKKRNAALIGHLRPTVKPDWDNCAKLLDACNGIVFTDDKQVVDGMVRKIYSEHPGLFAVIEPVEPPVLPKPRAAEIAKPRDLFGPSAL